MVIFKIFSNHFGRGSEQSTAIVWLDHQPGCPLLGDCQSFTSSSWVISWSEGPKWRSLGNKGE